MSKICNICLEVLDSPRYCFNCSTLYCANCLYKCVNTATENKQRCAVCKSSIIYCHLSQSYINAGDLIGLCQTYLIDIRYDHYVGRGVCADSFELLLDIYKTTATDTNYIAVRNKYKLFMELSQSAQMSIADDEQTRTRLAQHYSLEYNLEVAPIQSDDEDLNELLLQIEEEEEEEEGAHYDSVQIQQPINQVANDPEVILIPDSPPLQSQSPTTPNVTASNQLNRRQSLSPIASTSRESPSQIRRRRQRRNRFFNPYGRDNRNSFRSGRWTPEETKTFNDALVVNAKQLSNHKYASNEFISKLIDLAPENALFAQRSIGALSNKLRELELYGTDIFIRYSTAATHTPLQQRVLGLIEGHSECEVTFEDQGTMVVRIKNQ